MVITDGFSKSLKLIILPGLPIMLETAELIFTQVFHYFGIPEDIVSDHGTQFTSRLLPRFIDKLRVSVCLTSG